MADAARLPRRRALDRAAPTPPPGGAEARSPGRACCPFVGPLVLFIVWDLVVRLGFIKPILLPTPVDDARRAGHRPGRRAAAASTSRVTVLRTLRGLPDRRGGRRAAGRPARQQREGLPQRRVPDRLLPLDAVVGADPAVPADLRRVRHQQGRHRRLRRAPDRRLQQRLRRHQRAQAARHGGAR